MTLRSGRGRARNALAALLAVTVAGCSALPGGTPTTPESPELVARYGQAPANDPSGFTYQPDVVVVDGGAAAVRSVRDDGLVWIIDGAARGMSDLDVGEVMFLTSRAVGRVAAKEPVGDDVAVTLAPVQLHEVIRDGRITVDAAVDPADPGEGGVGVQEVPGAPGVVGAPEPGDADLRLTGSVEGARDVPAVHTGGGAVRPAGLVRQAAAADGKLPAPKDKLDVTFDGWGVTTALDRKGLTLSVYRKSGDHLKVGADITFGFKQLRLATDVVLTGGKVAAGLTSVLHGMESLEVKLHAGLGGTTDDNAKVRIEVPAEVFNKPVLVGGVPLVLTAKVKVLLETALTGRNSTLTASGKWELAGPLGIQAGTALVPKFGVINSMLDSIGGITLGPSGLVIAAEAKFMVGVGVPGAAAGPYVKVRFAGGVTNGSAFGAPLARCTRVDLVIKGGAGMGLNIGGEVAKLISERLPGKPKFKLDGEAEVLWDVRKASQTIPDVPLCRGGG